MKKCIALLLCLMMALQGITLNVYATDTNDVTWTLEEGVLTITGTGEIEASAFKSNVEIEKIIICEGVTAIGEHAFRDCPNLKEVQVPKTVSTIGACAFFNCANLVNVQLAEGLATIQRTAFQGTAITAIDLPDSLTMIDADAFSKCHNLTEVTIPKNVVESGNGYWFRACQNLTKIVIAEGTTTILDSSLAGITTELQVIIPESVTVIEDWAFRDCSGMKELDLPENLLKIGNYAFYGCDGLTDVDIPDSVNEVGSGIFHYCENVVLHCSGYSPVTEYALRKNIPVILKDSDNLKAKALDTQGSFYTTNSSSLANSGLIDLVLKYEIREEMLESISNVKLIVLFQNAMELREDTLTVNGKICESYEYRNHELTIPVNEATGTLHFSINPQKAVQLFTMAKLSYTYEGETCIDILGSVNSEMPILSIITSPYTNQNEIEVCGIAPAKSDVRLYVDDVETATVTSTYTGSYEAILSLPELVDGKTYTIKATCILDETIIEKTVFVVYDNSVPMLEEALLLYSGYDCNYEYFSKELDLLDVSQRTEIITFNPEFGYAFKIKMSMPELIEKVYVTSTRNGITKYMEAVWSEEEGCYVAEGTFDSDNRSYVPGIIGVSYKLRTEEAYIDIPLVGMFIWIIDPSGYVYDAETGNPLADVVATIYYQDVETGEAVMWKAEEYGQKNPQLTQIDGTYSWDVPEGLWRVKFEKEGYETAYTEWMEIPPIRTDVNIGMTKIGAEEPVENPFTDVPANEYYTEPVLWAVEKGITSGLTATMFGPEQSCTRGQVVTFLWRAYNCPEPTSTFHNFTDLKENEYYYKAVLWAVENGITSGMTKTTFAPDETVTRGQFVTFLHRAEGKPAYTVSNPFTDLKTGEYYYDAVLWAVENKVTSGLKPTLFGPEEPCTRGQVVTFLYRDYNE